MVRWLTLAGAALGFIIALIVLILSIVPMTRPFVDAHGELIFALWPLSLAMMSGDPVIAAFVVVSNAIWYGALGLALADANPQDVPVAGVAGTKRTVFFVDREAAAEVPEDLLIRERFWTAAHEVQA